MLRAKMRGFALPTILIVSSVMMIVLATTLQVVAATANSLDTNHYTTLSKQASESGFAMARACLQKNDNIVTWSGKTLRPWTDCNGDNANPSIPCDSSPQVDASCWVLSQPDVRSTFSVPTPTTAADGRTRQITSNATVQRLRVSNAQVWRTFEYVGQAQSNPSEVQKLSLGREYACGLLKNAQLYCWGYNAQGVLGPYGDPNVSTPSRVDSSPVFAGKVITSISEGSFAAEHMCAVASGEAYCWGSNTFGQLGNGAGNGTFSMSADPVKVANGSGEVLNGLTVTEVAVGDRGSCAIASGRVYCWGDNSFGQLGNNNTSMSYSAKPVAVTGLPAGTVTDISYYSKTVCAVIGGKVYCWGDNQWGTIGDGTNTNRFAPVLVGGVIASRTATTVQTGHATTCVIASNEVYCWGAGAEGAVGDGTGSSPSVPTKVANGSGSSLNGKTPVQLSTGFHYNCARTSDGRVSCWGMNGASAQLGTGSFGGRSLTPIEVNGLAAIGSATELSSSRDKSCVLISSYAYCWGALYDGQLRFGVTTPTAVSTSGALNGKTVTKIAAGGPTSCASTSDGTTACWGGNNNGTIGDGTTTNRTTPTAVATLNGRAVSSLSIGDNTTCALAAGEFWCWGQNTAGKAGDGTQGDKLTPVRVTTSGVLSGKTPQFIASGGGGVVCGIANGAAHCWGGYASEPGASLLGNNTKIQANGGYYSTTPVLVYQESGVLSGKTITDMGVGNYFCVVASGSLYCWGSNEIGQLGINASNAGFSRPMTVLTESGVLAGKTVTKVATGRNFGCAATSEPNVYCWGYNFDGQYGDTTRTTNFKPTRVTTSGNALSGKTITKLVAGKSHTCALTNESRVYCWGYNAFGQLGNGTNSAQFSPGLVEGVLAGKTVTDITAQDSNTCAIADGKAYCWGSNDLGQVGDGNTQLSASPTPARSLLLPPFIFY